VDETDEYPPQPPESTDAPLVTQPPAPVMGRVETATVEEIELRPQPEGKWVEPPEPPFRDRRGTGWDRQKWLDRLPAILVFAAVYLILILLYRPNLMLSATTTSGGDMGAHHYPAKFLIDYLLPHFKATGWTPQWFLGMPMFTFYVTLPFQLIAVASLVLPYTVAFKVITALGVFMLPICMYAFGKLMRLPKPFPLLAPVFALGLLLMKSYSIYGGNIMSTLAGEFGYMMSFALSFLFIGTLYRGMERERFDWLFVVNALLLMCVVLTHIVTPIALVILAPSLLLITRSWRSLRYLLAVFFTALFLSAFWGFPFIDKLKWTASVDWIPLKQLRDLLPGEIRPYAAVGVLGMAYALAKRDKRTIPMFWMVIAVVILFYTLPTGRLWNGRLLPFFYASVFLWAAYGASWLVRPFVVMVRDLLAAPAPLSRRLYAPILAVVLGITAALGGTTAFGWIQWNYAGYEGKDTWPQYKEMMDFIGGLPSGRVMWEHNPDALNKFGTPRIFELIPYWTDQAVLEGTLMESSFSAPYVMINQAELSNQPSHAIGGVDYPPRNETDGLTHLNFMNVPYFVSSSQEVTDAVSQDPRATLLKKVDVVSIWGVAGAEGYVSVMKDEPLRVKAKDSTQWKDIAVAWYKNVDNLDTPIVWDRGEPGLQKFQEITPDEAANPPATPTNATGQVLSETIDTEKITFTTTAIGQPHWIKMSYFPNWHVKGAEGPYVVSPSFMMVIPTQSEVTLYYGRTMSNNVGQAFTVIGWLFIVIILVRDVVPRLAAARARRRHRRERLNRAA
jgi:hypothetical protein